MIRRPCAIPDTGTVTTTADGDQSLKADVRGLQAFYAVVFSQLRACQNLKCIAHPFFCSAFVSVGSPASSSRSRYLSWGKLWLVGKFASPLLESPQDIGGFAHERCKGQFGNMGVRT
jgi:hypothetical protein